MAGLKDKITQIAQEAALNTANFASTVIQAQINQQAAKTGLMTVQSVDLSSTPIGIQVLDASGNIQVIGYTGNGYPYPGQVIFVNNGYSQ